MEKTDSHVKIHTTLVILGLLGLFLVLVGTSRYGVGLGTDSGYYISAAKNLLAGKGYTQFNDNPLVVFPPLFSTLLAIFGFIDIEPANGARFFHAFVFGMIIFSSGQLYRMAIKSKALVILGTVAVLFSYPLLYVSSFAWTESLFTLLIILFIICLVKFLDQKRFSLLLLLSILAGLACLQKYIGVTIIFTGCFFIVITSKTSYTRRLKYVFVFGLISSTPLLIWLIRNYTLTSAFSGPRNPGARSFAWNTFFAVDTLIKWFVPNQDHILLTITGVAFAACVLAAITHLLVSKLNNPVGTKSIHLLTTNIFVLIYSTFLLVSATMVGIDTIRDRLLSPIYVFVIFLAFFCIDRFTRSDDIIPHRKFLDYLLTIISLGMVITGALGNERFIAQFSSGDGVLSATTISSIRRLQAILILTGIILLMRKRIAKVCNKIFGWIETNIQNKNSFNKILRTRNLRHALVIGICIIWLICPCVNIVEEIMDWTRNGVGKFTTVIWKESPLMEWVRTHPFERRIYSNAASAIYLFTERTVRESLRKHAYRSPDTNTDDIPKLKKFLLSNDYVYLIWFDAMEKGWLYSVQELDSIFNMEIITRCPDGVVYLIK